MNTNEHSGLSVIYLAIDAVKTNPRNSRTHSKRQVRQIADSIREFGFTNPILLDRSNTIIAGHGRLEAAKLLGMGQVPTIRIENLTADQLRAYVLADNKLAENAGWDESILATELQHLLTVDQEIDITITGFEIPEIDLILEGAADNKKDKDDNCEIIENNPAVTKSGDLWILGEHRLLCSDARDKASYKTLLAGRRANLVFTDPPYNVPIDGYVSGFGKVHHSEFAMASGEMSEPEFTEFLKNVFVQLAKNSVNGALHFICMDWRHSGELISAARSVYTEFKNLCVWVKDNAGQGSLYRSQHELVFVFKSGKRAHRNNIQLGRYGRYRTNVWNYSRVRSLSQNTEESISDLHPTIKPVTLVADTILDGSARGDIVLDPFLGSGSTLIAAERVGRVCFGIEIDPLYVDVAIRRWQKHTGDRAIHFATGKCFDDLVREVEPHHG